MEEALDTIDEDSNKSVLIRKPLLPPMSLNQERELSNLLKNRAVMVTVQQSMPAISHLSFHTPDKPKYRPVIEPISPVPPVTQSFGQVSPSFGHTSPSFTQSVPALGQRSPIQFSQPDTRFSPPAQQSSSFGQPAVVGFKIPQGVATGGFAAVSPATTTNLFSQKPMFTTVSAPPAHGTPIVVSLFGGKTEPPATKPVANPDKSSAFSFGTPQALNFSTKASSVFTPAMTASNNPPTVVTSAVDKPLPFSSLTTAEKPSIFSQSIFGGKPSEITTMFSEPPTISQPVKSVFSTEKPSLFGQVPSDKPKDEPTVSVFSTPEKPSGNQLDIVQKTAPVPKITPEPTESKAEATKTTPFFSSTEPKPFAFNIPVTPDKPISVFNSETPKSSFFGADSLKTSLFAQASSSEVSKPLFGNVEASKPIFPTPDTSESSGSKTDSVSSPLLSSILSKPLIAETPKSVSPPKENTPTTPEVSTEEIKTPDKKTEKEEELEDKESGFKLIPTAIVTPVKNTDAVTTAASTAFSQNVFGQVSSIATPSFGFGSTPSSTVATTSTPAFGTSVFGQATPTSTPVFAQPTTTSTSVFGAPASTTPLFGQSSFGSAATNPVFGSNTSTTTVFGSAVSTTTSVFGGNAASPSVFGNAATTTAPVFGNAPTSTTSSTTSVFGTPTFGQSTNSTESVFNSPNVFGQTPTTPDASQANQVTSLFGSMGGSSGGSMFGGSASFTPKPAASIFGGGAGTPSTPDNSGNLFGGVQACSPFDPKSSPSKSLFGNTGAAQNPFAASATANKPASPAAIFGQTPGYVA